VEDEKKSREELLKEIAELRAYVAELESRLASGPSGRDPCPVERQARYPLDADIEFIGDFDVVRAKGVNISEGGICFEVHQELPFEMRFDVNGRQEYRRAHCVWMRRLPSGGYHFGLRFVPMDEGASGEDF